MKKLPRWLVASVAIAGACSSQPPAADPQAAAEFKSHIAAPSGSARVYILPTLSKAMYSDPEGRAAIAIFNDGSEKGAPLAWTAKDTFVAFDIAPGTYSLMASTEGPFAKFTQSTTFENGTVYFLRPTFFISARDLASGGAGAAAQGAGMGFEPVPFAVGNGEIQSMDMAALHSEGRTFLAQAQARLAPPAVANPPQTQPIRPVVSVPALPPPAAEPPPPAATAAPAAAAPAVAAPVAARAPAPAPAPAAVPAPASPAAAPADTTFRVVEQKLKDLRRLREEGLITKEDYDAKRRAILDAY